MQIQIYLGVFRLAILIQNVVATLLIHKMAKHFCTVPLKSHLTLECMSLASTRNLMKITHELVVRARR